MAYFRMSKPLHNMFTGVFSSSLASLLKVFILLYKPYSLCNKLLNIYLRRFLWSYYPRPMVFRIYIVNIIRTHIFREISLIVAISTNSFFRFNICFGLMLKKMPTYQFYNFCKKYWIHHAIYSSTVTLKAFFGIFPSKYVYFDVVESQPSCTTLDLQLSFYRLMCYNSRAHCPLLLCLHTTSAILAGAHSYFCGIFI